MKFRLFLPAILIGIVALCFSAPSTQAVSPDFNMNLIILDEQFTDSNSMSAVKIQEFLDSQSGILKSYSLNGKSAAQIIYEAAQTYQISPKVILTTIQKESSMITRTTFPSGQQYYLDWVMFYGWCDSCSTGSNKGFANQVNAAAGAFRRYLNNIAISGHSNAWYVGQFFPISRYNPHPCHDHELNRGLCTAEQTLTIIPANAATAALYTYTPHPGGNYAFWLLWNGFGFDLRRYYPDGSLLKIKNSSVVYLIQGGLKRQFTSTSAFLSRYSYNSVVTVPADHLMQYENGLNISYANYSLLQSPQGGVYLLADDTKRPIKSRAAFKNAGFQSSEVIKVSWKVLKQYPDGEPITVDNIFPSGQLFQNIKTGGVYYVKDGVRHPIRSKDIWRSQFGQRRAIPVSPEELDKYQLGDKIGFKDGELVASKNKGGAIYFISNGQRLPISSWAAFKAFNFNLKNVLRVDDQSLALHPVGQPLELTSGVQTASQ